MCGLMVGAHSFGIGLIIVGGAVPFFLFLYVGFVRAPFLGIILWIIDHADTRRDALRLLLEVASIGACLGLGFLIVHLTQSPANHCRVLSIVVTHELKPGNSVVSWESRFLVPENAVEQRMSVSHKAPDTFWGLEWRWTGISGISDFGLITNGKRVDGSIGDVVVAGFTGSRAFQSASCHAWTTGSAGLTCNPAYRIVSSDIYSLRLMVARIDHKKRWWKIAITDVSTHHTVRIGEVALPSSAIPYDFRDLASYLTTPQVDCNSVPSSVAWFGRFVGTSSSGQSVSYTASSALRSSCAQELPEIRKASNGTFTGVELRLG
jgi:hypothetical protein